MKEEWYIEYDIAKLAENENLKPTLIFGTLQMMKQRQLAENVQIFAIEEYDILSR